jgi:hypothetical protein
MRSTQSLAASIENPWSRLEHLLITLTPGQTVTIGGVAARTGLSVESVDTVLQALTRAELFVQVDRLTFVRERLLKT